MRTSVEPRMQEPSSDHLTFEQALAELEKVVRDLEDGQTSLEESLERYERGVGLLRRCYGQLRAAEQRILLLTGEDGDGRPMTRPFEHGATLEAVKAEVQRPPKKVEEDGRY
jgi:exodeoxyribonuclease VII small subunit